MSFRKCYITFFPEYSVCIWFDVGTKKRKKSTLKNDVSLFYLEKIATKSGNLCHQSFFSLTRCVEKMWTFLYRYIESFQIFSTHRVDFAVSIKILCTSWKMLVFIVCNISDNDLPSKNFFLLGNPFQFKLPLAFYLD